MSKNKLKNKSQRFTRYNTRLRLCINRSNTNIYAQIIDDTKGFTLLSFNSLKLRLNKTDAAIEVGKNLATLALKNDITNIYFDRGNYRYTGLIKTLCDSARNNGLKF